MRIFSLLAVILVGSLACQSDQGNLQSSSVAECHHAAGVDDGGPGACAVGRAYLQCSLPSGTQCLCVTNDQSCEGCGPGSGATCQDQ